jgi:hypothetical protein
MPRAWFKKGERKSKELFRSSDLLSINKKEVAKIKRPERNLYTWEKKARKNRGLETLDP